MAKVSEALDRAIRANASGEPPSSRAERFAVTAYPPEAVLLDNQEVGTCSSDRQPFEANNQRRVRSLDTLEKTDPELLRGTAKVEPSTASRLVAAPEVDVAAREQYRRMATTLHQARANDTSRVVMVTSAVAAEGKTLSAANLALTFSESFDRRVLLIDADLRHPGVHELYGLTNSSGLGDLLLGGSSVLPITVGPMLSILPAGSRQAEAIRALSSIQLRKFIHNARDAYDWIIVDSPPLTLLPDAQLLTSVVDAVVLVVRAGATPFPIVREAAESIGSERLAGVLLNGVEILQGATYYGKYY